ncbi:MAG: hypothetical protein EBU96_06080 [Actinobacteria bacterium]|nr:hypothetical protein [Actinomycetota bacterium]
MSLDETKLNCAGEFMSACSHPHQITQAVNVISQLFDGGTSCEFLSDLADALQYASDEAERYSKRHEHISEDQDQNLDSILEFCHAYLVKAYNKKTGRA